MKDYKELEIILSDFACDKHCPYCTAKITKWDRVEDDIHLLEINVGQLKKLGYTFKFVTIGGNGEPTLYSYEKLKNIVEMFDDYDIPIKRVLSSGNIFRPENKDKYDLFVQHNWMIEVTTTSIDNDKDREILGYDHNYFETEAFRNARIRLNYVLLNSNINQFVSEILGFLRRYDNIETIALKTLNINTRTGLIDNPLSEWVHNNAFPKERRNEVALVLNNIFKYTGEKFDTHSWMDGDKEIYFSWKTTNYGLYDLVWYGNQFVTWELEPVHIDFVPKVYIASKFIKNGKSFADDFRTTLIGSEKDFVDFNNHSFIDDFGGNIKYQYLGPFYNEKASDGQLTSSVCEEVVNTENALIRKCDIFIVFLNETCSPGSIAELIYAATLNKKIIIFYIKESDVSYEMKSSNWYPIVTAKSLADNVNIVEVSDTNEIIERIKHIQ